mmetsp:Transcript_10097/g.18426  ORF Transcript_10097/g.18426 Transcript_10097/m.18426 type:complete len:766 (+) Transcript_10097:283-2580(+)
MHHTAAPAKRHHSQISMPSNNASSNTNHETHPFENFMHMFGNTFSRPTRQQRQAQQKLHQLQHQRHASQTQQQTHPSNVPSVTDDQALQPTHHHQSKQARQTNNDNDATMNANYTATSTSHHGGSTTVKPKLQSAKVSPANTASAWRTTLCPRSQKPYYWNVHTRESRWKKPLELASEEEKDAIQSKERKQREFFESMERNILKKLEGGKKADSVGTLDTAVDTVEDTVVDGSFSPVTADGSEVINGIDQSWMQVNSASNDKTSEDWISGWITPGSDATTPERGSSHSCGSFGSLEGLSVLDPNNGFSPGALSTSLTSLTSLGSRSREERDDKVLPLHSKPKMSKLERIKSASSKPVIDKPDLIRTISKMEFDLVYQLNPSLKTSARTNLQGTPRAMEAKRDEEPHTPTTQTCDILSSLHLTLGSEGLDVSLLGGMASAAFPITPTSPLTPVSLDDSDLPTRSLSSPDIAKPNLTKRNTCGTIYLGSTLAAPDKDALIKCVCGVYRAHLLQTETNKHVSNMMFSHTSDMNETNLIFHDRRAPGDYRHLDTSSIPSLSQITDFYRSIFLRSQMEADCIIISLIYIERLIKRSGGALTPRANNWRSILFSCMVLASKVWDDLSMWNCDFSKIGPSGVTFSLARTNELEIALLRALEYRVKVGASEYAKYYFLLRGMLCRSGLANDDFTRLRPLDAKGALTLETTGGEKSKVPKVSMKERSKSYGDVMMSVDKSSSDMSEDGSVGSVALAPQSSPMSKRVSLEQIVRM